MVLLPSFELFAPVRSTYDELSRCLPRCQGQQQLRRTAAAAGYFFLRHVHRAVKSRGRGSGGHSEEDSSHNKSRHWLLPSTVC